MNSKFIYLAIFLSACLKNDPLPPKPVLELPISIHSFCQSKPATEIGKEIREYYQGRIIKKIENVYSPYSKTTSCTYNSEQLLIRELSISSNQNITKDFIYNDDNQLVEKRTSIIQQPGSAHPDTTTYTDFLTYSGIYLIKETQHWGGYISYKYEGCLLSEMISHNSYGEPHHHTKYTYKGGRLNTETKITKTANPIYHKEFIYDSEGKLTEIIQDGKTVEFNIYDGLKLIEKRVNDYGIDPCFSACCGNFIYLYNY